MISVLIALCLVVLQCFHSGLSVDLLDPPQTIRGIVWQDWNEDGVRQEYEPGFPHATVRLLYQPSGESHFLIGDESTLVESTHFFTLTDGQFYFSCLTTGNYSIQVELPESRPSTFSSTTGSDITSVSGRIGSTEWFTAQAGDLLEIEAGVVQYVFMNLFPMTGRENVPTEPDTTLGTTYSVFDSRKNMLYYRIERGPWNEYNIEDHAGFYKGFPGENGDRARPLADKSAVKTNQWMIPTTNDILPSFKSGRMYVLMHANGSHSDNARLRGNFNPLYTSKYLKASVILSGENVVPSPVSTLATGTLNLHYNMDGHNLTYDLTLSSFGRASVTSIRLYGPASFNSVGADLGIELKEGRNSVNVSAIPNVKFNETFITNQIYVQVNSDQYPNGHIRAQLSHFSQVVYYTSSYNSMAGMNTSNVRIALALDTVKHTLTYYSTIQASSSSSYFYVLGFNIPGLTLQIVDISAYKSGVWVGQGFFWNLSPEQENSILSSQGDFTIRVGTDHGNSISFFDTLLPNNWY